MTCQRSKSRLKKKGKITKYDDPSTKVVYNSTTKYDFVSICLQILLKSAKINQRVTTTEELPKRHHGTLERKQTRNHNITAGIVMVQGGDFQVRLDVYMFRIIFHPCRPVKEG